MILYFWSWFQSNNIAVSSFQECRRADHNPRRLLLHLNRKFRRAVTGCRHCDWEEAPACSPCCGAHVVFDLCSAFWFRKMPIYEFLHRLMTNEKFKFLKSFEKLIEIACDVVCQHFLLIPKRGIAKIAKRLEIRTGGETFFAVENKPPKEVIRSDPHWIWILNFPNFYECKKRRKRRKEKGTKNSIHDTQLLGRRSL